jgi:Sulfotransferase family
LVGEAHLVAHAARIAWSAGAYGVTAVRVARRGRGVQRLSGEERLTFVVGAPRSGTTFTAESLGGQPGWVDLGEVPLLKAAIPELAEQPVAEQSGRVRRIIQRVRTLGLARGLRGVEQTPETAFVLGAALRAFPQAQAVHVIRDGRDVVCSLLERGWFRADRGGVDDARRAYGAYPRFWVEPERADEFSRVSEARRAAWAWRRYVGAVRAVPDRVVELRYESLVAQPAVEAERLAAALRGDADALAAAFERAHDTSVGRWRHDLTSEQVLDVEDEAGELLAELGYA